MMRNLLIAALAATSTALVTARQEKVYTVELEPGLIREVTEEGKLQLRRDGKNFIDITDHPNLASAASALARADKPAAIFPTELAHADAINGLLSTLNISSLQGFLKPYTEFETRYYKSPTGIKAAEWLLAMVKSVISASDANATATVRAYTHRNFDQISIIAKIPGKSAKTIVTGAHLDSTVGSSVGRSPGADDNGSGTVTILEAMRVLLWDPKIAGGESENSLEFHWYAGEEAGLLGSADIMAEYAQENVPVAAYLNQDMTGWAPKGQVGEFGVIMDHVDQGLTDFCRLLIDEYTSLPSFDGSCGYACSDHASATAAGFPAAFIFEAHPNNTSPYIHTTNDTYDTISFDHVLQHAKLVTGFMYELAFASL